MLELPWPHKSLSPNWRGHWGTKSTHTKKYRKAGWALGQTVRPNPVFSIRFHPPKNNKRRNIDNAIASIKPLLDGLQDAWGIDDANFKITWPTEFSDVVKGGKVVVVF